MWESGTREEIGGGNINEIAKNKNWNYDKSAWFFFARIDPKIEVKIVLKLY